MNMKLAKMLPIPDHFRRCHAYSGSVDAMLRKYETSLRNMYNGLVDAGRVKDHVTFGAWNAFLVCAGIVNADISDREGMLCFVWSRMLVFDGQTWNGRVKESCMPFEGFMEALCRLAVLKGLPTAKEVEESGLPCAGSYLIALQEKDANKHRDFITEAHRKVEWGEEPPKSESLAFRLEGLIRLIILTIEGIANAAGANDEISHEEMKRWVRLNEATFKKHMDTLKR